MTNKIYPIPRLVEQIAYITEAKYQDWYQLSCNDVENFWAEQACSFISFSKPWESVLSGSLEKGDCAWFDGAKLNASYNCLDRHLKTHANETALIWESDSPSQSRYLTYRDLYDRVCRLANVLKRFHIKKGDRVCIYLPMIPEAVIAMLACARIGAIHSVVFAGFSSQALKMRIQDANCKLLITANEGLRGNKSIPLKQNVDAALQACSSVETVIIVKRTETSVPWQHGRDYWYHDLIAKAHETCAYEEMNADDSLFILYTSGSTGKPKGILHGTAGYLVYVAATFKYIFDYHKKDVYWCTADIGWITGHSYGIYGPLLNAATIVLFEGVPHFPTPARYWEIIDKHQVTIFYTAPTAIRALRREGDHWVNTTNRLSLRILGSVGEPINPEAWEWYFHVVGKGRCPILDTWWQTETGGIMLSALPGATPLKPGSAAWPFFSVLLLIVDDEGKEVAAGQMGKLLITHPWPGMMKTIYGDHNRFMKTYLTEFPGRYVTGDQAYKDSDGYYWILGRNDDVLKISGHRIGTQEVESALIEHPSVAEAAVVSIPDPIKGNAIYAFITLKVEAKPSDELKKAICQVVHDHIGGIAVPSQIQWAEGLPKTRSGKIMRRLLSKIANNETSDMGDLSTLADPSVIEQLIYDKLNDA